jgi:hypothetical protein
MNGWNAMVDLSQVQSWKAMNALFAPAQQLIQDQGAEAANFAFGMVAPPAWFVNFAAQASWAGIMLGVLFAAAGVGLLLFRKAGMWLLGIALASNILLQGILQHAGFTHRVCTGNRHSFARHLGHWVESPAAACNWHWQPALVPFCATSDSTGIMGCCAGLLFNLKQCLMGLHEDPSRHRSLQFRRGAAHCRRHT